MFGLGRKKKEEDEMEARKAAYQESERHAHKIAMKAWQDAMAVRTDRIASLGEFDQESIDAIHDIATNKRFYALIAENDGQIYAKQHMLGRGHNDDPILAIALYYNYVKGCHEGEARIFINFGRASEGLGVIKSRYNLVNRLLNSLKPDPDAKRNELQTMIDGLNNATP